MPLPEVLIPVGIAILMLTAAIWWFGDHPADPPSLITKVLTIIGCLLIVLGVLNWITGPGFATPNALICLALLAALATCVNPVKHYRASRRQ